MTKARDIANLVDSNGDVVSGALDNVPASNDASALTTGTLPPARIGAGDIDDTKLASGISNAKISGLSTVATTGAYSDVTGTPTLSTVATSGNAADLNSSSLLPYTIMPAGTVLQTVTATPNTMASGNPVNTWSEINSNYRISITPKFSNSRFLVTYSIPINPTGAANILMAIAPWYSTNGGSSKTIIGHGISSGSRHNLSNAWFRSSNGYDSNDMDDRIIKTFLDPNTSSTLTFGFYFRSEGGNTTYFNHTQGNNSSWGWTAPTQMEVREVKV